MLQDYSYEDRFAWILRKKEEGSQLCKDQKYKEAIDIWMQAMCGYEFGKYKKDKKNRDREPIEDTHCQQHGSLLHDACQ